MNEPSRSTSTIPPATEDDATVTVPDPPQPERPADGPSREPAGTDTEPPDPGAAEVNGSASAEVEGSTDPAAADPPGSGEVEVDCPGCGLSLVGEAPRPTAEWFCPRCDYPLFWATQPASAAPRRTHARRRLPGTGGTLVLGSESCWHCGEMNEPGTTECRRCAATLPKPNAPTIRVREPVPVPVPVVIRVTTWPFVAAGICGGAAVAAAVTMWVMGAG